jgi:hypothetical protein
MPRIAEGLKASETMRSLPSSGATLDKILMELYKLRHEVQMLTLDVSSIMDRLQVDIGPRDSDIPF